MDLLKKIWFPVLLTLSGIIVILNGISTEQNGAFMLGAFALLVAGVVSLIASMSQLSKMLRLAFSIGLGVLIIVLAYADYQSIKVPIDFQNEKEARYEHVVQRLKDIRTAELAYKAKYQRYTGSMDSLVNFINSDSLYVIKAFGEVPDGMTEENAIDSGFVTRDTLQVSVYDSLFGERHTDDRLHSFDVDSLPFVPFTRDGKFELEANMIERSGAKVPVFRAKDGAPFDKSDPRMVGSLTDPKTNGNWE
jgi:hypothetical protein